MRKISVIVVMVLLSALLVAQTNDSNNELVKLKLELIDSEVNLIQTKMLLFEKDKSDRLMQLDSLINKLEEKEREILRLIKPLNGSEPDYVYDFKSSIGINPYRLFEGSLFLSYERNVSEKLSLDIGLMGCYISKEGMGGVYMSTQIDYLMPDSYCNDAIFRSYNSEMITGFGILLELKNYLKHNNKAPLGIYAAPQVMYRRINIIGRAYDWEGTVKDVTDRLDVFKGGVVVGKKIKFAEVLYVDLNIGGVMRLSKYVNEKQITKYKNWNSIDYSGILPTLNVKIGILR